MLKNKTPNIENQMNATDENTSTFGVGNENEIFQQKEKEKKKYTNKNQIKDLTCGQIHKDKTKNFQNQQEIQQEKSTKFFLNDLVDQNEGKKITTSLPKNMEKKKIQKNNTKPILFQNKPPHSTDNNPNLPLFKNFVSQDPELQNKKNSPQDNAKQIKKYLFPQFPSSQTPNNNILLKKAHNIEINTNNDLIQHFKKELEEDEIKQMVELDKAILQFAFLFNNHGEKKESFIELLEDLDYMPSGKNIFSIKKLIRNYYIINKTMMTRYMYSAFTAKETKDILETIKIYFLIHYNQNKKRKKEEQEKNLKLRRKNNKFSKTPISLTNQNLTLDSSSSFYGSANEENEIKFLRSSNSSATKDTLFDRINKPTQKRKRRKTKNITNKKLNFKENSVNSDTDSESNSTTTSSFHLSSTSSNSNNYNRSYLTETEIISNSEEVSNSRRNRVAKGRKLEKKNKRANFKSHNRTNKGGKKNTRSILEKSKKKKIIQIDKKESCPFCKKPKDGQSHPLNCEYLKDFIHTKPQIRKFKRCIMKLDIKSCKSGEEFINFFLGKIKCSEKTIIDDYLEISQKKKQISLLEKLEEQKWAYTEDTKDITI
ncbi:hypothetical protein M0813_07076 [Anaeramoeba flamelloides]|uniref:Uncharacterized protein n=1 Tax=Anaeramoeba flamelloides TaxID=1746091 RepID=A0ABQ8XD08_9EUKA|nr:hypothetical protein M0813_07076 [Anaeramoeba flamelloides]